MEDHLISVKEAEGILLDNLLSLKSYEEELSKCTGMVLNEPVFADRHFPPFDRVMMDGFAISFQEFEKGHRKFKISGFQPAGEVQQELKDSQHCIEVMTGAVLPLNADTVIPYEKCTASNGFIHIGKEIGRGQNIHLKGADRKGGDLLLKKGSFITPAEIGVLATVGKARVNVLRPPKIAIVSTGDELVDIQTSPENHQIRKSNSYTLISALHQNGLSGRLFHLKDEKEEIINQLQKIVNDHDVILMSGGVSKGKKDFIPEALHEIGVKELFHRVAQRPGKPFYLGKSDRAIVFGFPGNPVSTFICFYRYFLPWYKKSTGGGAGNEWAILDEDFLFKPNLTCFLQVKINISEEGKIVASPAQGNGSGDLISLAEADGFLELPSGKDSFKKGSTYPLYRYRY